MVEPSFQTSSSARANSNLRSASNRCLSLSRLISSTARLCSSSARLRSSSARLRSSSAASCKRLCSSSARLLSSVNFSKARWSEWRLSISANFSLARASLRFVEALELKLEGAIKLRLLPGKASRKVEACLVAIHSFIRLLNSVLLFTAESITLSFPVVKFKSDNNSLNFLEINSHLFSTVETVMVLIESIFSTAV